MDSCWQLGLEALLIYFALLVFHGYRFGDEDMTETLSYALYLSDSTLFPSDLYIQAVGSSFLNERFPFAALLSIFNFEIEWSCFFLHVITSFLLLFGLLKISSLYLKESIPRLCFAALSLLLLYNITLGGNEIWYNYFVPSHLAKSIGIWSIYFFLIRSYRYAYVMAALSTFAQPVVGAQLALLWLLCQLIEHRPTLTRKLHWLMTPMIYAGTAGIWVVAVFVGHMITDDATSSQQFYEIMETRLAHHFFPSYYPTISWIFLTPLMVGAVLIWRKRDSRIYRFMMISMAGMVAYVILIELFESSSALSLQWFKTSVWLKPISVLAFIIVTKDYFPNFNKWHIPGMAIMLVLTGIYRPLLGEKPFFFPWKDYSTEDMELATKCRDHLPAYACMIIPPDLTGVRFQSQRSIFVDYKSNIHSKSYMKEATRRRQVLYDMTLANRQAGRNPVTHGVDFYHQLTKESLQRFKDLGATHVWRRKGYSLDLPITLSTSAFTIYEL